MKIARFRLLLPFLFPACACAQGLVQNMEVSFMGGPTWYHSQTIVGTDVKIRGSLGPSMQTSYAYQVVRSARGNLWVEFFPMTFFSPGGVSANVSSAGASLGGYVATPGVRYMVPVLARVSIYGVLGGGYGSFEYASVQGTESPHVRTKYVYHGAFEAAGGLDLRLTRLFSVRAEFRDFVTGKGLAGVSGRHHATPLVGIAAHF
jgi:hypothetical protein